MTGEKSSNPTVLPLHVHATLMTGLPLWKWEARPEGEDTVGGFSIFLGNQEAPVSLGSGIGLPIPGPSCCRLCAIHPVSRSWAHNPHTVNRHFSAPHPHPGIPGLRQEADPCGWPEGRQGGREQAWTGSCLGSSPGFLTMQITHPERDECSWLPDITGPWSPGNP